jgi:hypothetical protein
MARSQTHTRKTELTTGAKKSRPLSKRAQGELLLAKSNEAFNMLTHASTTDYIAGMLYGGPNLHANKKHARAHAQKKHQEKQLLLRLEAYELIRRKNGSDPVFEITKLGTSLIKNAKVRAIRSFLPNRNTVWDKKWRCVTFDIPESKRRERDALRYVIKQCGFMQVHKNVWVFPFETPELLEYIYSLPLSPHMISIGTFESLSNDKELRKKFKLK